MRELVVGDLCILDVESSDVARQYAKVLQVSFVNGDSEMFDLDKEPVIKEAWERYRTDSDRNTKVTAETLDGGHIQFDTYDILTMAEVDTSSPEFHLLYPAHLRMVEWRGQLLYEIDERNVLAILCLK